MAEVRVEDVSKSWGATRVLTDITLDFPDGSFFGLLGPSGSGKTTLLRLIAGFAAPDRGRVMIGGAPVEHVPVERRDIGMVFQNYALFPNMTVAENVGFGLRVRGLSRAEEAARVAEALALVRLDGLAHRRPDALSGGQRQRVAMARAIAPRPRVLLLDEPLSALDKALRVEMQVELKRIQREVGITTIFVTHDQEEALTLSDRIGLLRDGRLVREGPPQQVYDDPGDAFTARFLGEANILTGTPEGAALRLADGSLLHGPGPQASTKLAVRPEALMLSASDPGSGNRLAVTLTGVAFAGATATAHLDWGGAALKAGLPPRALAGLAVGQTLWAHWPADRGAWLRD